MTLTITPEFARALAILDAGDNLFLTGKAGTGKSTLIRHFMTRTDRRVVVVAPTGIAALNVDGHTIHRLFSFRSTTSLEDVRTGPYRPGRFMKTLMSLQTLIVDEASMVRADLFDMLTAALERFGPRPGTPFGGVQVVLVGDLLQLPPVVEDSLKGHFAGHYATPYFFSAHSFERADFPAVALTTVFRQQGDDRLTALLNAVREGILLDHAQVDLNSRVDPDFEPPEDELWLTLAPSNRIVTARNRQRLDRLDGEVIRSVAVESGDLSLFDAPTERVLTFKVGAQVMMLSNDAGDRWVNGTLGKVVDVEVAGGEPEVTVEFADGSTARVDRFTWDVLRPVVEDGRMSTEVVGTYTQLPFKLAWAITIHKSQGQTLDRLVVDLTGGVFAEGQVYVALSRATSLEGLVLTRPIEPRHLRTDRRIVRYLHESSDLAGPARHCAVGISFVGDEGTFSRPRPIELAVAFDDGTALSTLVNPERDLADARAVYAITADDVLLAPTLPAAWATLAPLLEGCTPVGIGIDEDLGKVDFELKRQGRVLPMPLGVDVTARLLNEDERQGSRSPRALDRARAALSAHGRLGAELAGGTPFALAGLVDDDPGYLLTRDGDVAVPRSESMPTLSAIVDVSRAIGHLVLDGSAVQDLPAAPRDGAGRVAAAAVAERLANVATTSRLSPSLVERLRHVEQWLGIDFVDAAVAAVADRFPGIDDVLVPGARICFTGTAIGADGRVWERADITELAQRHGLQAVANVSKTRCDVLVVAEVGTQSGKARKAREYGKPVLTAEEFFTWASAD